MQTRSLLDYSSLVNLERNTSSVSIIKELIFNVLCVLGKCKALLVAKAAHKKFERFGFESFIDNEILVHLDITKDIF